MWSHRTLFTGLLAVLGAMGAVGAAPSPLTFSASFEGTVVGDSAGRPVPPAAVSGKVEYQPGKVGQALVVGGDAAQLKFPVRGLVRPTQGTVAMWVRTLDWPADEQAFHVFFETEGPGWLLLYRFYTGGLSMLTGLDRGHYAGAFWQQGDVPREGWHHLAGTWRRERVKLFLDGKLVQERPYSFMPRALTGNFHLGDDGWHTPHASHTLLDEVKIYRYALPDEQIARLAQGETVDYRQGMPVDIEPRPARGQWRVTFDAGGYVTASAGGTRAVVSALSGGRETSRALLTSLDDGIGVANLDLVRIPPGPVIVRVVVFDAAGKEIARADTPFVKPAKAAWEGSKIGLEDRVLPPFTPITVEGAAATEARAPGGRGRSVECWGRRYAMDGLLPTQIESAGAPLLAAPITLRASDTSGDIAWQRTTAAVTGWSPTVAHCRSTAEGKGLNVAVDTRIEYDGMVWSELTLTPAQTLEVTDLTLQIPLHRAHATYLHHVRPLWGEDAAGLLPDAGYEATGFLPYLWLGDDDRGLAWFAESDEGWTVRSDKPTVQVARQGDQTILQIHFINMPTRLDRPRKLAFGLQATPVKPRPSGARGWRMGNLGTADTLTDPSRGNLQSIWPDGNLLAYGYPWPADVARFREVVKGLHDKGTRVMVYVNLNYFSTLAPEFAYCSPDWLDPVRCVEAGDVMQMGGATMGACPNVPAWRDFIATKLAKLVDEFGVDGIYVDCWNPVPCAVEEHGCGWRDAQGNLHARFSILGSREIVRRVREILIDRRPDAHIMAHMSANVCIPMLSFADSMLDGEQYQGPRAPNDDYLSVIPLDKWRTENTGRQWGVVPFFLPMFAPGDNRKQAYPSERLMGLALAHDCGVWPVWCNTQVIFDTWAALDKFGITNATFAPYWKPNGVTAEQPETVVSVYRKPGTALLVVLNTALIEKRARVRVDPGQLGLREGYTAYMAVGNARVPLTDGTLEMSVPARGHVLVILR